MFGSFDPDDEIKKEAFTALFSSIEKIREAVACSELNLKLDFLWQAHAQLEYSIGITKLAFEKELGTRLGRFREIESKQSRGKTEDELSIIDSELERAESETKFSLDSFSWSKCVEGLEHARRARDILKVLLLRYGSRRKGTASK
jgi:hypothetical protein